MQKRPLQDVIPPAPGRNKRSRKLVRSNKTTEPERVAEQKASTRKYRVRIGLKTWTIAVVAVVVLGLALSLLFSGSRLTIYPKQRDIRVEASFQAVNNPGPGELGFEVMTVEVTSSEIVPTEGESKEVALKASGRIVIFNNHSVDSQRLIKNTRFETPDGLIYRISNSIEVPGQKIVNGEMVAGSIEVEVYADQPGETYNIGLTDFTIPGFAGTPRFETFYARSKTVMTGGFEGVQQVVSEEVKDSVLELLRRRLASALLEAATAQKPDGFILYENANFIEYEELSNEGVRNGTQITLKGIFYGILLEEQNFAAFLASQTVAGYEGVPVEIVDSEALTVSIPDKNVQRPWEDGTFQFGITGNAKIVWLYEEDSLKRDLAGKPKDALITVLSGYPSIDTAEAIIRPFWRGTFPDDSEDIKLIRKLDG